MTRDEATAALELAIHQAAEAHGGIEPGEVLTSWVLVACYQPPEGGVTGYVQLASADLPCHSAVGLYALGHANALKGGDL